jgi:hypothetical protein
VCHDDRDHPASSCDACGTRYHADCRRETGRCPTLGCDGVWLRPEEPASNAWSVAVALAFLFMLVGAGAIVQRGLTDSRHLLPRPDAYSDDTPDRRPG